jgi:hypothetical protein
MQSADYRWRERLSELIAEADPELETRVAQADAGAALAFVGLSANVSAEANELLRDAVAVARRLGASWDAVGAQLGVSRQAAQQRFALDSGNATAESPATKKPKLGDKRVVTGATAFNELEILQGEGAAGWQLGGCGSLYLEFLYVGIPTEHLRISSNRGRATRRKAAEDRWSYCCSWVYFHYFSRPLIPLEEQ